MLFKLPTYNLYHINRRFRCGSLSVLEKYDRYGKTIIYFDIFLEEMGGKENGFVLYKRKHLYTY